MQCIVLDQSLSYSTVVYICKAEKPFVHPSVCPSVCHAVNSPMTAHIYISTA